LLQSYLNHLRCEQGSDYEPESLVRRFVLDHEEIAAEALAFGAAPASLVGWVVVVVVVVQ
jgi:hypothetical protein